MLVLQKIMFCFLLSCLLLIGCAEKKIIEQHQGKPFVLKQYSNLSDFDKNIKKMVQRKIPVQIKGRIKYQDKILGEWAFIETNEGLVFVDFAQASPNNLSLPKKPLKHDLLLEGYLAPDETVLNGFLLIPYAYESVTKNNNF